MNLKTYTGKQRIYTKIPNAPRVSRLCSRYSASLRKDLAASLANLMDLRISEITPKRLDLWMDQLKAQSLISKNHSTRKNFRHELELLSAILRYYQDYHDDVSFQLPLKKRHREAASLGGQKTVVQKDLTEPEFLRFKTEREV